jgi:acetylglutamate kinase
MLKRLDIPSSFVDGKRVTDAATVEVVEMVLSGTINKRIVQAINAEGGKAVGLSGKDASLMICEKDLKTVIRDGQEVEIDLGLVGRPVEMHPEVLQRFLSSDFIPVVAPVGMGRRGETFNVNGDTAAGAIAAALKADRLLLLTDVAGVKDAEGTVLTQLSAGEVRALIASGVISGGMIPKAETVLAAVEGGVRAAVILDGRAPHAVLLELFTAHGAGTLVRAT